MRYPLSVKSKSVETSGIPRDYKEASVSMYGMDLKRMQRLFLLHIQSMC